MMKRILTSFLIGAGLGILLAAIAAPSAIEWWAKPGLPTPVDCSPTVTRALDLLRFWMIIGGVVVGVAGTFGGEWVHRVRMRRGLKAAAPTT